MLNWAHTGRRQRGRRLVPAGRRSGAWTFSRRPVTLRLGSLVVLTGDPDTFLGSLPCHAMPRRKLWSARRCRQEPWELQLLWPFVLVSPVGPRSSAKTPCCLPLGRPLRLGCHLIYNWIC